MSAIATVLMALGHQVSGSDLNTSPTLDRLAGQGARALVGHRVENLQDADLVAVSSAIGDDNAEVAEARRQGLPVLRRAEVLAAITRLRRTVAVGGTHGKTTTSSMLALVLDEAGWEPSFIIGGELNDLGPGARWSHGEWLVVEADESDGTFLELQAEVALVTSVEPDHLDRYGTYDSLKDAFTRFLAGASGLAVASADFPDSLSVARRVRGSVTFGMSAGADYRIVDARPHPGGYQARLEREEAEVASLDLHVPGPHNLANAAAAATVALGLGVPREAVEAGLRRFSGVARRFQLRGERDGISYVDDYAHLPGEVMAALQAARQGEWPRVVCVFQPHRYSRTAALWADFAQAFNDADLLVVTDVYPAGEEPLPGVSGNLVVQAVLEARPDAAVTYQAGRQELVRYLRQQLRPGDLCLTLGAGDLTTLPDQLLRVP
jgi:UDP-N-acetylmuramate--alanine ligase